MRKDQKTTTRPAGAGKLAGGLPLGLALALALAIPCSPALARNAAPALTPSMPNVVPPVPTPDPGEKSSTLQDALMTAYSTNPTLLTERAKLRATDEGVPQALAGWRPQISVSGSAGYATGYTAESAAIFGGKGTLKIPGARDVATAQANFTQPIYRGGRTVATLHRAENTILAERARLIATEELVFANVVNSYVGVIQDQQLVAINQNNAQVLDRQLQATNDRFHVGELTQTDVAQAQAGLAAAQALLQTSQGTLQSARASFRQYVGYLPGNLSQPQPLALPVKSQDEATREAAVNNPTVVAATLDDAGARDAIDVAYSALMPNISVQASTAQLANPTFNNSQETSSQITANLTVPIYQGGTEYSAIRQARQSEQQARKTVDDQRRQAVQQAAQAWETLVAARATIDSDRLAVHAYEIALEGIEREALLGSATTLDVLIAQQQLLTARQTLVQNLASLVTASYGVANAIGRLDARDLNLPVSTYDETAYYRAVRNKLFGVGDAATTQPGR